jgi:hypothetical protein
MRDLLKRCLGPEDEEETVFDAIDEVLESQG